MDQLLVIRLWLELTLAQVDEKISVVRAADEERSRRRAPPEPPRWWIEYGIGAVRKPDRVHTGACPITSQGRAATRETVLETLRTVPSVIACPLCRPDRPGSACSSDSRAADSFDVESRRAANSTTCAAACDRAGPAAARCRRRVHHAAVRGALDARGPARPVAHAGSSHLFGAPVSRLRVDAGTVVNWCGVPESRRSLAVAIRCGCSRSDQQDVTIPRPSRTSFRGDPATAWPHFRHPYEVGGRPGDCQQCGSPRIASTSDCRVCVSCGYEQRPSDHCLVCHVQLNSRSLEMRFGLCTTCRRRADDADADADARLG
ncbi:DUF6233 domain-containing protein [Streptomyces sp. NPDC056544]|uniref:DUF6233 domain-containing protein n=1 Tax=unclassified Streptomyces TaxID=2593676 RepID=UPI003676C499